jgi:hypothetical protein
MSRGGYTGSHKQAADGRHYLSRPTLDAPPGPNPGYPARVNDPAIASICELVKKSVSVLEIQ